MTDLQDQAERILGLMSTLLIDSKRAKNPEAERSVIKAMDWMENILDPLTPSELEDLKSCRGIFMETLQDEHIEDYGDVI